jgi:DNA mismatch repair protein MutL
MQRSLATSEISMSGKPVRLLPPELARKIAAGEVVDRPCAVVRELLDNAVDAGASEITVEIEGGGIGRIRVVDNGGGMSCADLMQCAQPHATSKISEEVDLLNISTLGFRGEALSSIAAVSRLSVASARDGEAWRFAETAGDARTLQPASLAVGTVVESESLFANMPARRVFLKRPAAEAKLCKDTVAEKALPRADISFRFVSDGGVKLDLPAGQSEAERFVSAFELDIDPCFLYTVAASDTESPDGAPRWSFTALLGEPDVFRLDRRHLHIYANGRRINEYALMQAVEYGAQGFFPNGTHPVAVLFLHMSPALIDFNIHPAKREARFKDIAPVHHALSAAVRRFFHGHAVSQTARRRTAASAPDGAAALFPADMPQDAQQSVPQGAPFPDAPNNPAGENACSPSGSTGGNPSPLPNTASYSLAGSPGDMGEAAEPLTGGAEAARRETAVFRQPSQPYTGQERGAAGYPRFFRDCFADQTPGAYGTDGAWNHQPHGICGVAEPDVPAAHYGSTAAAQNAAFGAHRAAQIMPDADGFRYIGQTLGVFLLAEKADALYLIDQHAAHERILYNRFVAARGRQQLLVPYVVEADSAEDDAYLESIREALNGAGFATEHAKGGGWEFAAVPVLWQGTEADLRHDLLDCRAEPDELLSAIAASAACRAAIKERQMLDAGTAAQLARDALALSVPRCPHGRPIWYELTRDGLYKAVKRL